MGGVSPGRFICGELAGWEHCKTALAASLSDTEQPQAGVEPLLGTLCPSRFCFIRAAGWKLFPWALLGAECTAGRRESGQGVCASCSGEHTVGEMYLGRLHKGSARGQYPSPSTDRASPAGSSPPSHPAPVRTSTSRQEWELAPRRLAPQVNCGVP